MIRHLTLSEYLRTPGVPLSAAEVDGFQKIERHPVDITPSVGQPGCYDLTPGSQVEIIELETLAVEIRPKIEIDRVLFLVSYAVDPDRWRDTLAGFATERSLVEAIAPGFAAQARRAFRRGLLTGYRAEEDALQTVRGRVRFEDQLRRRFGRFPPAEVRYDEFTADIEENRLVKAAMARLRRTRIRSAAVRASLRALDGILEAVKLVEYDPRRLPTIIYTHLNSHYRPAVELAKLILRTVSIELRRGEIRASAFLVDMNEVFENFVVVALRDALGLSERAWPQGARCRRIVLDQAGIVDLEPDLSWWDGNVCTFVGDVKYKRVSVTGIKHPDLYQLLAYTVATNLPGGLLIYAAGEGDERFHRVVHAGKDLHVIPLDLRGGPHAILAQIDRVATMVRELRVRPSHVSAA